MIRLLWTLSILLLGFALSGMLYPARAEVLLCGAPLSPDPDGIYRLRGHLACSGPTILDIENAVAADTEFDLRGFIATGNTTNDGVRIRNGANNVIIVGGIFKECRRALRVNAYYCMIEKFIAINSSESAFRIEGGTGNTLFSLYVLKSRR